MFAFGPIPSRRLGYSLGINHIPPKNCTYSCVYCQVGRTKNLESERRSFFSVEEIVSDVDKKIKEVLSAGKKIDYLTLVPDGEPTLDTNLPKLINQLKSYNIPIAIITNASLIDQSDVRKDLMGADWVSVKIDSLDEATWRKVNRPNRNLRLESILEGILKFKAQFAGELVTETMLVSGINDNVESFEQLANFFLELQPQKSYLSIPTRPPAEAWVRPPDSSKLKEILSVFTQKEVWFLDILFEPEVLDFTATGDVAQDILSIAAVHPLREEAVRQILDQRKSDWELVEKLLNSEQLIRKYYCNEIFYVTSQRGVDH